MWVLFSIIKYVVHLSDLYYQVRACSTIACQSIFCVINFYTRHSFDYPESKTTGSIFCLDHEPVIGGDSSTCQDTCMFSLLTATLEIGSKPPSSHGSGRIKTDHTPYKK